jgi:hypothetical protein
MKKILLTLLLGVFVISAANESLAQKKMNAGEYMTKLNKEYRPVSRDSWDYMRSVAHSKNGRKIARKREDLLKSVIKVQKKIGAYSGFGDDTSLRDSILNYLRINEIVIREDYDKIMDLEAIAEDSYDMMEAYLKAQEIANQKMDIASDHLDSAMIHFAERHNVTLQQGESRKSAKIKMANEAFAYYNQVFLIYFKSMKQEAYLLEAIQNGDMLGIEQNKNALLETSVECLAKLDSVPKFKKTDGSLITACRNLIMFHKFEAEKKMKSITDFYMKKEKFDKLQQAMENKSGATKQEINKYNQEMRKYNTAVNNFNRVLNELNNKRTYKQQVWQNVVEGHFTKYVAKH